MLHRTALAAAMLFSLAAGCSKSRGAPPSHVAPKPPYEAVSPERLRVREDLVSQLAFAPARSSEVCGTLQGFGRVAFAPNASYAVRVPFPAFVERVHVAFGTEVEQGRVLVTLHLRIDPARLAAAGVSVHEIYEALKRTNANAGGGYVGIGSQEFVVRRVGALRRPVDLRADLLARAHRGEDLRAHGVHVRLRGAGFDLGAFEVE
jgi:hypothetical protein